MVYIFDCIYRRPNNIVGVFISESTSGLWWQSAVVQTVAYFTWYQYFYAASKWCFMKLNFLDELGWKQQITVPTHKIGYIS